MIYLDTMKYWHKLRHHRPQHWQRHIDDPNNILINEDEYKLHLVLSCRVGHCKRLQAEVFVLIIIILLLLTTKMNYLPVWTREFWISLQEEWLLHQQKLQQLPLKPLSRGVKRRLWLISFVSVTSHLSHLIKI